MHRKRCIGATAASSLEHGAAAGLDCWLLPADCLTAEGCLLIRVRVRLIQQIARLLVVHLNETRPEVVLDALALKGGEAAEEPGVGA